MIIVQSYSSYNPDIIVQKGIYSQAKQKWCYLFWLPRGIWCTEAELVNKTEMMQQNQRLGREEK